MSAFHSKTVSLRLKSEARPRNPMNFYDRLLFSCLLIGDQSSGKAAPGVFLCLKRGREKKTAGRAAIRVRSTEDEHAAKRQRSPKPATRSGAGRKKGCEAPRTSTPRRGSAVRSPRREAGRAAKKGAKHRGRARREETAQSEARDARTFLTIADDKCFPIMFLQKEAFSKQKIPQAVRLGGKTVR